MLTVLAILALHAAPSLGADCEEPMGTALLDTVISDAEQAMGRNAELFSAAATHAQAGLPCLGELVEPALAARLHRVLGVQAMVGSRMDRALQAFAASHRIQPDYAFPAEVFPPSHPIARLYQQASGLQRETEDLSWMPGEPPWFDGAQGWGRPASSATLMQQRAEESGPVLSHYLWPGEGPQPPASPEPTARPEPPPPAPVVRAEPAPVQDAVPLPPPEPRDGLGLLRGSLLGVTGVSAVAAGVSFAAAARSAADYRDNEHDLAALDAIKARNNRQVYASAGLGVVALGAGVGLALSW